jgi:hypothetical protein
MNKEDTMTNTRILNDADLDTVTGGNGPITLSGPSVVPHIPQAKDLLTPEMIAKILTPGINFPIPRS